MRGELNIPNRERRARRRILTLKNAGFVALGLVVLLAGLVLYARRHNDTSGSYGRLSSKQVEQPEPQARRPLDVITEGPVPDRAAADPMNVGSAVRGQYLDVPPPVVPGQVPLASKAAAPGAIRSGDHVAIVGNDKGVAITPSAGTATPKLTGGFGRAPDVPVTVSDGTTRQ
jgi:hypothetical protein